MTDEASADKRETDSPCPGCEKPLAYNITTGFYQCECGFIASPEAMSIFNAMEENFKQADMEREQLSDGQDAAFKKLLENVENPDKLVGEFVKGQQAVKTLTSLRTILDRAIPTARQWNFTDMTKPEQRFGNMMAAFILEMSMEFPVDVASMIPPLEVTNANDTAEDRATGNTQP